MAKIPSWFTSLAVMDGSEVQPPPVSSNPLSWFATSFQFTNGNRRALAELSVPAALCCNPGRTGRQSPVTEPCRPLQSISCLQASLSDKQAAGRVTALWVSGTLEQ